jgi:hypothetical protein
MFRNANDRFAATTPTHFASDAAAAWVWLRAVFAPEKNYDTVTASYDEPHLFVQCRIA